MSCMHVFMFLRSTACVVNGTDICIQISAYNCDGGTSPEIIINEEYYLFQEIYNNFNLSLTHDHFEVTYSQQPEQSPSICFRNIRKNIRFIEFCPLHSQCTSFLPSDDEELVIQKKIEIDVRSGN